MATSPVSKRSPAFRIPVFVLLAAGTLLLAGTPASAVVVNSTGPICVPELGICITVIIGPGFLGACVHRSGGDQVDVQIDDGVVVYYPDGNGYSHTGYSSNC